jgi:hypothetical protein
MLQFTELRKTGNTFAKNLTSLLPSQEFLEILNVPKIWEISKHVLKPFQMTWMSTPNNWIVEPRHRFIFADAIH